MQHLKNKVLIGFFLTISIKSCFKYTINFISIKVLILKAINQGLNEKFLTLTICALLASSSFFLTSCGGWNPAPSREIPTGGVERAKKNEREEGKGISLGALGRGETNTNYQFSTSNPMWRAAF